MGIDIEVLYGNERLPYGAKLTKEERAERRKFLARRWRNKNSDIVSERNHYWHVRYRQTKPYIATCYICGKKFNAPRDWYKTCPECLQKIHDDFANRMEKRRKNVAARKEKYDKIVELLLQGDLNQMQIAKLVGTTQATVSYVKQTRLKGGTQ